MGQITNLEYGIAKQKYDIVCELISLTISGKLNWKHVHTKEQESTIVIGYDHAVDKWSVELFGRNVTLTKPHNNAPSLYMGNNITSFAKVNDFTMLSITDPIRDLYLILSKDGLIDGTAQHSLKSYLGKLVSLNKGDDNV